MKDGQRVRCPRLGLDRDEHTALFRKGVENAPVVRLEPDAPHRAREPEFEEFLWTAEGRDERAARDSRADAGQFDAIGWRPERSLDECRRFRTVFDHNRERLGWKTGLLQRVHAFVRPREVLKHTDRE